MRAGVAALRQRMPARIVAAVPVAAPDAIAPLRLQADDVVCLIMPEPFFSISHWYHDFAEVSDVEVSRLLARAWDEALA